MDRMSIAQEYFLLAVDEETGIFPPLRRGECQAGLVAAGVMDLLEHHVAQMERKTITILGSLPDQLTFLQPLYQYLQQKPRTGERMMGDYLASTGGRIKELTASIGRSLVAIGAAEEGSGGLFGNKPVYLPKKSGKEETVARIRAVLNQDGGWTDRDLALLCILQETRTLALYLSPEESGRWKERLKAIRRDPHNRHLADLIHYLDDLTAVMAAVMMMWSV